MPRQEEKTRRKQFRGKIINANYADFLLIFTYHARATELSGHLNIISLRHYDETNKNLLIQFCKLCHPPGSLFVYYIAYGKCVTCRIQRYARC